MVPLPELEASLPATWLRPRWSNPGVQALFTGRAGGVSHAPFDSLNLRAGIGDTDECVALNRQRLLTHLDGAVPVWLNQVHGSRVVQLRSGDALPGSPVHDADASLSTEPGLACAVQVADCLPVLFSARGRAVAAAHAGWRGLAGGVLENTVAALCSAAACSPAEVEAWLGPCIGPRRFEVGPDVLGAFGVLPTDVPGDGPPSGPARRFQPRGPAHPGKWLADLPGLARDRLRSLGLVHLQGAEACTVDKPSAFFSFRRDGRTGRMAALVWLDRPVGIRV